MARRSATLTAAAPAAAAAPVLPVGPAAMSLFPVLAFLAAMITLDGYKLVRPAAVARALAAGALAALLAWGVNLGLLEALGVSALTYSRWVAPLLEEVLKGLYLVWLLRTARVGFLVDAAVLGAAVGAGFACVENVYVLRLLPDAGMLLWAVRGLGAAIMHAGASALLTVGAVGRGGADAGRPARLLAGLGLAVAVHSVYNNLATWPVLAAMAAVVGVPAALMAVYGRGQRSLRAWLGSGLDTDLSLLDMIRAGRFLDSPAGRYVRGLGERFPGPVLADLLCYLQLNVELAIRAKGLLLAREAGFEPPPDPTLTARLAEWRYLERSIGRAGLLALQPVLPPGGRERWRQALLGSVPGGAPGPGSKEGP